MISGNSDDPSTLPEQAGADSLPDAGSHPASPAKADGKDHGETPPADDGYMHPDLAASLAASLRYARHGLAPDEARADEAGEGEDVPSDEDAGPVPPPAASGHLLCGHDAPAEDSLPPGQGTRAPEPDALAPSARGGDDPGEDDAVRAAPPSEAGTEENASGVAARDAEEDVAEEEEENGLGRPMSLRDHLNELRKRIFRAFCWAIVGFIACYPFAQDLFGLLMAPLTQALPSGGRLIYTSPPEAFFTYMKVSFIAGLFLTSPLIFYQIWAFVAPGLYREEKIYILPIAFFSSLFFICGGLFCYFVAFPVAFEFFMSYSTDTIVAMPGLNETLSFVLHLLLAFGLVFELPLFSFFLSRLGIVTADMMRKARRYAILANFIVAAILTPPDVASQLLMACPLLLLYEFSIAVAAVFGRKKKPQDSREIGEDDGEESEDDGKEDEKPAEA
jgi:sec-independent protein translocase protein TatC